ncbi:MULTISPECIES: LEA type 2 family protein [unclassified Spirosoma]|uniref:LEA type 2 family protein n=1 Tax=unclassified Spirosoma TaxID=2621999 RepID=UPI0009660290|nr:MULTISPECIES: LEA type 2 family protein [unclassified Spirosoma]MBN8821873.1 LEA type 2 family protein [Spirosoma sp.]OJW80643.1 MAG: permease [Spirosoma sp. 48-14]
MKKGWIIALVVVLLLVAGGYIWYSRLRHEAASEKGPYDNTLKPRLELTRFDITGISDDAVDLTMYMLIDNPLPVGFKAHQLDYTVFIANTPIVKDAYKKPIELKAGDSTLIKLPVKLMVKTATSVLKPLERKDIDSTTYKVSSSFALDIPILGEKTFTTTIERRLPTFFIPKIKIEDIDFGPLGLKRTDVAAKVAITNKNRFPMNITDAHYTVTINGKQIAEGDQPEPILIKAQATTPVIFPVTARPGKTLSVLPKMLFDKKDTPYEVTFRCKLIDRRNDPMLQHSKFASTIRGTLDDFKKLKK